MIEAIKKILGIGPSVDFAQLKKDGVIILDVRTKSEFAGGHIKGAINISVDQLANQLEKFKDKQKPIITCCASGMRSASAKRILKSYGYQNVYNGGSWYSLQNKLR